MATSQRKSRGISLGITAALAASLLSGCGSDEDPEYDAICIDPTSIIRIKDELCDDNDDADDSRPGRWYYISPGSHYPAIGGKPRGGSLLPPKKASVIRKGGLSTSGGFIKSSSTSRGGFGGKSGRSGG